MSEDQVRSYFRIGNDFVPIDEFEGVLPDRDYIDGAIVCSLQGRKILGFEQWDLVDQLWGYIVDGLSAWDGNGVFECCFPDQPLRLRFEKTSPDLVKVIIGEEVSNVNISAYRDLMKRGATDFFSRMEELFPQDGKFWSEYLEKAKAL